MPIRPTRQPSKQFVINAPVYPPAVDPSFLCQTEADRRVRAYAVLEGVVREPLAGLSFGDHAADPDVVAEAVRRGATLDPPHDVYLLYDVLDHVLDRHPREVLVEATGLVRPGGRVYVRLHPWCSRHGTHLYHQLNKAFLSVYLTPGELAGMGLAERPTRRFSAPLDEYRGWVPAGLAVAEERVHRTPLEPVFGQLRERGWLDDKVFKSMDIDFVDLVLRRSDA